jgi:hypothetical protein
MESPEMPFCSERCRLLDLGNWASERYVVSTPLEDSDEKEIPEPPEADDL